MFHRLAAALIGLAVPLGGPAEAADGPFWKHWGDGKAELNGYALRQPRYGEVREGRAVLIFVTEPYSRTRHVKVDRYDPDDPDHVNVLKLNAVRRFQTGVYDYALMTSVFAEPDRGFRPLEVAFGAQEWCGLVHEEARFDDDRVTVSTRSYFEGESGDAALPLGPDVVAEDALPILLRGLDAETLAREERAVRLVPSATHRRLRHAPLKLHPTRIEWTDAPKTLTVPAGTFEVHEATYGRADGVACTYQIEVPYPHRLIGWRCADGEEARLTGTTRLAYWKTNREGDERHLEDLGLKPMRMAP